MRNQRGDITTDPTAIKRIMRNYYEQLDVNKFDKSDKVDKFLEISRPLKLTQEETENLSSPIFIKEIEVVVKNLPTKNVQAQVVSPENYT